MYELFSKRMFKYSMNIYYSCILECYNIYDINTYSKIPVLGNNVIYN